MGKSRFEFCDGARLAVVAVAVIVSMWNRFELVNRNSISFYMCLICIAKG